MFLKYLISIFVLIFISVSCARLQENRLSTSSDLYWGNLAQDANDNADSFFEVLKNKYPHLYQQIMSDSKDPKLTSFWGESYNFDSGARKKIIADQLLSKLHGQFNLHNDNMIVHAGITHTYGYLLSLVQTPYGFKRKRWIEPTLNYAFSLSANSLSPYTSEGGLLSNITYFAGMIAFKDKALKDDLKKLTNVSKEVSNFNYKNLKVGVLEEEIAKKGKRTYTIRTTLVTLPKKLANEENDYWLIYSIYNHKAHHEELITAFPIKADAYKKIVSPELLGVKKNIEIRYNAHLGGYMEQKITGKRIFH